MLSSCDGIETEIVPNEKIIELTVKHQDTASEIENKLGDGNTVVRVIAVISANADVKFRDVTFNATDGIFIQTGKNSETKRVTNEGIADVLFRLPLSDNEVYFTAEIGSGEEVFMAQSSLKLIGVKDVVTLAILDEQSNELNSPVLADGNTILTLAATVNFNQEKLNQVTFKNSGGGKFLGVNATEGIVNINEENVATLQYEVPNALERIFFLASVGESNTIFDDRPLDLERAYPDEIILEPSAVRIEVDKSITLNAFLLRDLGKVSIGTRADFDAFQLDDIGMKEEVGRFTGLSEPVTDSEGKISVIFFADSGNFDVTRPVFIRVSSQDDSGDIIISEISINVE